MMLFFYCAVFQAEYVLKFTFGVCNGIARIIPFRYVACQHVRLMGFYRLLIKVLRCSCAWFKRHERLMAVVVRDECVMSSQCFQGKPHNFGR